MSKALIRDGSPLVVSVHDIAPGTAAQSMRWLAELDRRGIPATLLLIPGPWRGSQLADDPELVERAREAESRGHELALHGFHHVALRNSGPLLQRSVAQIAARGAAEFAVFSEDEATARLRAGLEELAELGIEPVGFHPPGWLVSAESIRALRRKGLRYYSTHLAVHAFGQGDAARGDAARGDAARGDAPESAEEKVAVGKAAAGSAPASAKGRVASRAEDIESAVDAEATDRRIAAPALSHRPGGRGEQLGVKVMLHGARYFASSGRPFRIALHPDDMDRPALRAATLRAIDDAIELGARPTTYADLLGLPRSARECGRGAALSD